MMRRAQAGLTLIEVLIAVALLSVLSVGILLAMRVGLDALGKADSKLMDNRRVAGAQRILEQQIEGFLPALTPCAGAPAPMPIPFFEGEPDAMRFISTFSLQEAWRGYPRILEYTVIPRDDGHGVRLIVNEILYTGPLSAGRLCLSMGMDPAAGGLVPHFAPVEAGPNSFVLADKLAVCRFAYQEPPRPPSRLPRWVPRWMGRGWPLAIRIEMASSDPDPSRLPQLPVTVPLHIHRSPDIQYVDQ